MPMLPNQYHPGQRCSCRECLIGYPDAEKLDSEREAAVTAMDQEIEALKHDNERLVRTNADLASEQHVPAAVVEFVNGKASVILDSKFLSGLTEGSHVLYAAPQEHDAISGSYAPTRPAVPAPFDLADEIRKRLAAPEETPSDAIRIAQETVNSAYGTADRKMLAREVLRKAHPAVTPQEWRELGRLEGVAECAKVALAYTRAPGPDWTKMAPEWETKPEMFKVGYAYASGCSEQADDIHERIIALKDVSEYVHRPSWVPVEQAMPKDGKPVIAFVDRGDGWTRRLRAYYAHQYTIPAGEEAISTDCCEYVEADDEYYLPAGWYESNEYEETNWHVSDPVTHWMELPDGPSSQNGQPK